MPNHQRGVLNVAPRQPTAKGDRQMSQPRPQPAAERPCLVQVDANSVGQPPTTVGSERRHGAGPSRAGAVGCQQGGTRRPSLREQIPHLSVPQLAALRRVVRAGGRLPTRALPHEMTTSLLAVRAVSANRRVGELRLG